MSENEKILKFDLLENGLDFIESAIEHFMNGTDKKDLKYGVLNLSSGIELVFKYRLSQEHWTLLFQKINGTSKKKLETGDFKSVDSENCIKRLQQICEIKFEDKVLKQLKKLRKRRNKLEHFGISESALAIKASSIKVLHFIYGFINNHINLNEISYVEVELIENIKNKLIKFEDFINQRWKEIENKIESFRNNTTIIFCPKCDQLALVIKKDNPTCIFCKYTGDSEEVLDEYVYNILGINAYEIATHGGEYPVYECLECCSNTMTKNIKEGEYHNWICFSCGLEFDEETIDYCDTCATPYFLKEDDLGMCSNCIDYRINQ